MEVVKMEFRCKLCNRLLRTPESIERGYGIKCYNKLLDEQQLNLSSLLEE